MVRGWSVEPRRHPDPVPDEDPPAGLDYDKWLGPAPERPYNRNRFSRWRYYRDYGNGEMGDDGIHDIDLCCLGLGAKTHPVRIEAHGSEINLKGETEYPNHVVASFQYADGRELLYETRNWAPYKMHGFDSGNIFYGEEGYMLFTRRGMFQTYLGGGEKEGPGMKGGGGNSEHMANFLDSIRSGGETKTNADAWTAHLSCAIVHLGEISFRTGRVIHFDPENEAILSGAGGERDERLTALLTKKYREPWGI
ncbi:MAG: hypothetical protein GWO24_09380 [Akkermansiaceae bacterium]|nr:hypothetical protein [Akkermansiaceae bacterium]